MLSGHFDVVRPEPDDCQFRPRIDGDYLWGRGAADMKTVVASDMLWMVERAAAGPPFPPINMLLVGNEENGEGDPFGTPHVLADLEHREGWAPELMLVGERTGEEGERTLRPRLHREPRHFPNANHRTGGVRPHRRQRRPGGPPRQTRGDQAGACLGVQAPPHAVEPRRLGDHHPVSLPHRRRTRGLQHHGRRRACSGSRFVPCPATTSRAWSAEIESLCRELGLETNLELMEPGVACPPDNVHLARLLAAVETVSGVPAVVGKEETRLLRSFRPRRPPGRVGSVRHRPPFPRRTPLHPLDRAVSEGAGRLCREVRERVTAGWRS